jgi:hypothetical protein
METVRGEDLTLSLGKAIAGDGIYLDALTDGSVNMKASRKGLVKINIQALERINDTRLIDLLPLHNNDLVEKGSIVAFIKPLPLILKKDNILQVEGDYNIEKVISVKKIITLKVKVIVTDIEIFEDRLLEKAVVSLGKKVKKYGGQLLALKYIRDDIHKIDDSIKTFINEGVDIIIILGTVSVYVDDKILNILSRISDRSVACATPVLPGAMIILAYKGNVAIIVVPTCNTYNRTTVFDLIFPRLLTGEIITHKDIIALANGGLCLKCAVCKYPVCPIDKSPL